MLVAPDDLQTTVSDDTSSKLNTRGGHTLSTVRYHRRWS